MDAVSNFLNNASFVEYLHTQFSLMQVLEFFLRLVVASVCGAVIGVERTKRYKEAGIRTHVIVCMAATLFMIVSKYGFADLTSLVGDFSGTKGADPSRIASQVVSGISFLGAGVIFKNGNTVKGLTTAAGIWATAAIGLALGSGMYYVGLFGTVLIVILQFLMHKFKIGGDAASTRITLEVTDSSIFAGELQGILAKWHAKQTETRITVGEDGSARYDITLRTSDDISPEDITTLLACSESIKNIAFVSSD